MEQLGRHIHAFIREERGAVAVDWVVLTGAVSGLGLATMLVVTNGVESLSTETSDQLAGASIVTSFFSETTLFDSDFSNGLGAWLGGTATSLLGFGDVLMVGTGETTELTVDIPPGSTSATFSFDLISGDDLDGDDQASIMINGQPVAVHTDDHGNVTVDYPGVTGVTVSVDHQATNEPLGAGGHGHDSLSTYTITVDNPGSSLTLGVNSGTDEPTSSEFYALDNVSVVAE